MDDEDRIRSVLRVISHELKQPLIDIRNQISLFEHAPTRFDIKTTMVKIKGSVDLALALSDSLTQAALEDQNQKIVRSSHPVDAEEVFFTVRNALHNFANDHEFQVQNIQISVSPECRRLAVQKSHLSTIFLNALTNSIKYNERDHDEGWVSVKVFTDTPQYLSTTTEMQDNSRVLVISIADNGTGVEVGEIPHIFARGYRGRQTSKKLSPQGLGLGLAVIKALVTNMDGEVHFVSGLTKESEQERLTVLRIELPTFWLGNDI